MRSALHQEQTPISLTPLTGRSPRLLSVDLLRGITIAFMILVNNNGDEAHAFAPLRHAVWNGFTPTDLVFPTFLFLVGVSLVLATGSRLARGVSRLSILRSASRRALTLYALGLIVNGFPLFHLASMRYYGVLHRIAICYLIATILVLIDPGWRSKVAVLVGVLLAYWVLLRFVPVPGYGVPTHTVPLLDRDGNLVAWIDRQIFSAKHLYEGTRDPEGLLSTLPAIGTILIGVLTADWLQSTRTLLTKIRGMAMAGLSSMLLGGLWSVWFPINKKLWTSSYVLWAGGLSLLLFSLAMWLVDLHSTGESDLPPGQAKRLLLPFFVFGSNSIAAYVFSELLAGALGSISLAPNLSVSGYLFSHIHQTFPNAAVASLGYSLLIVLVCWIPVYLLYRRRIFLKV